MMKKEDALTFGFAAVILTGLMAGIWIVYNFNEHQSSSVQTASATTDYFSWSCQQLQDRANQDIQNGIDVTFTTGGIYWQLEANSFLKVMQLKGCGVSP